MSEEKKLSKFKTYLKKALEKLQNHSFSKPFIAAIFLLFGISGTLLAQTFAGQSQNNQFSTFQERQAQQIRMLQDWQRDVNAWINNFHRPHQNFINPHRFFEDFDPFFDMRQIHHEMRQRLYNWPKSKILNSSTTSISNHEDEKFVYYQLNLDGFDKEDVTVKIADNYLSFLANKSQNKESEDENSQLIAKSKSNFLYSFALPQNIDVKNPDIEKVDGKIIVRFRKK